MTPADYHLDEVEGPLIIDVDSAFLQEHFQHIVNEYHKNKVHEKYSRAVQRARAEHKDPESAQKMIKRTVKEAVAAEKKNLRDNDRITLNFVYKPKPKKPNTVKAFALSVKKYMPLKSVFEMAALKMNKDPASTKFFYGPEWQLRAEGDDTP